MEKVICNFLKCPFNSNIKSWSEEELLLILKLFQALKKNKSLKNILFGRNWIHTGMNCGFHDFTNKDYNNNLKYLSIKTSTVKVGRVAPTFLGQASITKLGKIFKIENCSVEYLKQYIPRNIKVILPLLLKNTFPDNCITIYYNHYKSKIYICKMKSNIDFTPLDYW